MNTHDDDTGSGQRKRRSMTLQFRGWILFILCALFFIAAGIANGDVLTIAGSILFLIACVFFVIPLAEQLKGKGDQ